MTDATLTEIVAVAEQAARAGGEVLRRMYRQVTAQQKSCAADLVTEADVESQRVIHEIISTRFPDDNFLGEEGLLRTDGTSGVRWIIDPLDGTSNYFHGFPYFAVSIGVERHGELVAGVIYDPLRDEMFSAATGQGATLDGDPIHVSEIADLGQAFLLASFPPGVKPDGAPIQRFLRVLPHAQTIQRTGSAALNLAYLAAGRLEGFWSTSLKAWDMAAGVVLVREAGGVFGQLSGAPLQLDVADLLATNGPAIQGQLSALLTTPSA